MIDLPTVSELWKKMRELLIEKGHLGKSEYSFFCKKDYHNDDTTSGEEEDLFNMKADHEEENKDHDKKDEGNDNNTPKANNN